MNYEQLSLSSFIKEIKEVSDGAHPRKFCFILGAGASRTSGIKSGQELVKIWDRDLRERNLEDYKKWRDDLKITDSNMSNFYSQYYEKRFSRCRTDGYNYIEKIMDSAKPSAGYVMLAHLLTRTPHNVVITTNFDHLTEDAVNYYAQNTPLVIGHESLAHYISGQPVRPTIIKIHRDLLFDPKSRSEDLEKLHDNWKIALGLIFANYHPIFIGYAGNDKSLMDFLVENGSKFAEDEWKYPYWLLYKTDKIEGKVEEFLEKSRGCFIRHSGFDDVMIQLGDVFDYRIPTEESFLEDARKRYKALADAIDAFSDKPKNLIFPENVSENTEKPSGADKENTEDTEDKNNVNQAIQKIVSQSQIQNLYLNAVNTYRAGNYTKAEELSRQLIQAEPNNARYHSHLGDVFFKSQNMEGAIAAYQKALELEPEDAWNYYKIAELLEDNGQPEEALKMYRKACELEPDDEFLHYFMAYLLYDMGQYDDALTEFYRTTELAPDELNYRGLARTLFKLENYEEALEAIQTSISIDQHYAPSYETLSEILHKLNRHKEADEAAQKAAELKK